MQDFVADRESAGKLAVSVKTSQYQRPRLCAADEALSVCQSAPEYHLGPRWYEAGADRESAPYRYWCAVDFDGDGKRRGIAALVRPFRDAERFAREELQGLTVGDDYVIGPSGRKGAKLFLRWLTPFDSDAAAKWRAHLDRLKRKYPTLDSGIAFHATHRGPWSVHPKAKDRVQAMLGDPSLLVRDPAFCQSRTKLARPLDLRPYLPQLEQPPERFSRWWDACGIAWTEQRAQQEKQPRRSYRLRNVDMGAILAEKGHSYTTRTATTGRVYLRVKRCIYCDGRHKAAVIVSSGFYRCYSANCAAADGLKLREWAGYLGVDLPAGNSGPTGYAGRLIERARPDVQGAALLRAYNALRARLYEIVEAPGDTATLIRATPGVGKTHATLEAIRETAIARAELGERWRVVFAAPTRELAAEAHERLTAGDLPFSVGVEILEGRNASNCEFPRHIEAIGKRGWSPGESWCAGCPYQQDCGYYARLRQALKAQILICAHEQAIHLLEGDVVRADLVVLDEDPIRALTVPWQLPSGEILALQTKDHTLELRRGSRLLQRVLESAVRESGSSGIIEDGQDLCERIASVAAAKKIDALEILREAHSHALSLQPSTAALAGASLASIASYPSRGVVVLLGALLAEYERWAVEQRPYVGAVRLHVAPGGLAGWQLTERRRPSFVPHLLLDAYGDPDLYEQLLGCPVEVVRADADLSRSHWWNLPVNTSRRSLSDPNSPAWRALDQVVAKLRPQGQILIASYLAHTQAIEDRYNGENLPAGQLPISTLHYGRGRGIDAYRDHAAVILFGVPEPPEHAILERAALIWQDDDQPLDPRRAAGNRRIFRDRRVQAVVDSLREAEAAQTAHRVRPARSPKTIVSIGLVDYPDLPKPSRWSVSTVNDRAVVALEEWARGWYDDHGWFTVALLAPDSSEYPGERPTKRQTAALWRRLFKGQKRRGLSPHPRFAAIPTWGDREAARQWLRAKAHAAGFPDWEAL